MTRLLAFDLETTGLDPERDRIMEFCLLEVGPDLAPAGEPLTALVDPGRPIPPKVQEITGITPDMVEGKPGFAHHAPRIQRLVADATLIAHNHRFDVPFLHRELTRAGQPGLDANHPCVDTRIIEAVVNSHSLEATYQRYTGKTLDGAHRSRADTEATVEVLRQQIARHTEVLGSDLDKLTQPHLQKLRDPTAELRTWLDHKHCFYQEEDGVVRFGFSKHRDEPVHQNESFLIWMQSRDFPPDTMALVERFIEEIRAKPRARQTELASG